MTIEVDEKGIIELLRRESEARLRRVVEDYGVEGQLDAGGQGKADGTVVSKGLKLRLKDDKGGWPKGTRFTVAGIEAGQVKLKSPPSDVTGEPEVYTIPSKDLDQEYELE